MTDLIPYSGGMLAPAASLDAVLHVYQAKKDFIGKVLTSGLDYGVIPGTGSKPALLKPGAEKLASFFGISPAFSDVETVEDWTGEKHGGEMFFYYRQRCTLTAGGRVIATADGSCNSWEKKYRYRNSERTCPNCGKPTIIKGKAEYGGGFVCFAKKGGCGAKFGDDAQEIIGQAVGVVKNPDVAESVNTILKMAQKRALIAAVLIGCGASDYFTQDVEDFIEGVIVETPKAQHAEPGLTVAEAAEMKTQKGTQLGTLTPEQLEMVINGTKDQTLKAAASLLMDELAKKLSATD